MIIIKRNENYIMICLHNEMIMESLFEKYLEEGHSDSRFSYVYSNEIPLWTCVNAFLDTVNFHAKERPIYNKKQGKFN